MGIFKLLLVVLLMHTQLATASDLPPKEVATSFYSWVIKRAGGGLPSNSALKAGEPVMSSELVRLLRKAKAVEKRCVATTPSDMKPPIFEGSLFVDNYEGATRVISMDLHPTDTSILVSSRLEFKDPRWDVEAINWSDQLTLVRENGKWVVGNIKGPGSNKSLIVILTGYIHADCKS